MSVSQEDWPKCEASLGDCVLGQSATTVWEPISFEKSKQKQNKKILNYSQYIRFKIFLLEEVKVNGVNTWKGVKKSSWQSLSRSLSTGEYLPAPAPLRPPAGKQHGKTPTVKGTGAGSPAMGLRARAGKLLRTPIQKRTGCVHCCLLIAYCCT